jgi:hypothetical protein
VAAVTTGVAAVAQARKAQAAAVVAAAGAVALRLRNEARLASKTPRALRRETVGW